MPAMSIDQLITLIGQQRTLLFAFFLAVPLLALLCGLCQRRGGGRSAFDYLDSALVYLAAVPGMFAAVLTFYALFILHANLLKVDALVYFMPILSMGATLWLIARRRSLEPLPGFGRIWGLMLLLALVCILVLLLYRLRFVVGFFGSLQGLLIAALLFWWLVKLALSRLKGEKP